MKIMVGYDGSEASRAALELAKKHALVFGATIHVVTSLVGDAETSAEAIEKARQELELIRQSMDREAIPAEIHLLIRGLSAGEDLVKYARDNEIDEAVVGVKKTSPMSKVLFGSNARYVILRAPCPVLTVKDGVPVRHP